MAAVTPQVEEQAVVRDMYGPDDARTKRHRETQLIENSDVLFKIYCRGSLHVLLFRPEHDDYWIDILKNNYNGISSQWTFKHVVNQPNRHVMNLSGNRDELRRFCDDFPANLEAFNAHVQEIEDLRATIRDLEERIRDLELENGRRRQQ